MCSPCLCAVTHVCICICGCLYARVCNNLTPCYSGRRPFVYPCAGVPADHHMDKEAQVLGPLYPCHHSCCRGRSNTNVQLKENKAERQPLVPPALVVVPQQPHSRASIPSVLPSVASPSVSCLLLLRASQKPWHGERARRQH